jgi:hypothetical protein
MVTKPKLMVPFQSALIKSFNISPQRDLPGLKKPNFCMMLFTWLDNLAQGLPVYPGVNGAKMSRIWGDLTHKRKDNCEAFRWANAFVPEGQADRSQAQSAWEGVSQQIRPVGYGPIGRS